MGTMNEPVAGVEAPEPHSVEAERGVLAAMLIDSSATFDKIGSLLRRKDFFDERHGMLFDAMTALNLAGKQVDPITVMDTPEAGTFDRNDGSAYLRKLIARTTDISGVEEWARVVKGHSLRREVIAACSDTVSRLRVGAEEVTSVSAALELQLQQIGDAASRGPSSLRSIGEYAMRAVDQIQEAADRPDRSVVTGISTPFSGLDAMTAGLQRGDLIILAARPSMGKTSLALQIAEHVAAREGLPIVVFSMEMGGTQLAMRSLSALSRIDHGRLRTGDLRDEEWSDLTEAVEKLLKQNQLIDTECALNAASMRVRARQVARQHGGKLGLIVVDYLQLMSAVKEEKLRAAQIAAISSALKGLAKELDVPVIALSQLNRSVELRPDKRPILSDLRDSGSLEQDADVVIFIYRDDYYNANSPHRGLSELILAKQRNGPTGMVLLRFIKEQSRHEDMGAI